MNDLRRFLPNRAEWFLIAGATATFLTGAILLVLSPTWWGWYLQLLDPRYWSYRGWIIAGAIVIEILIVTRFCAKNTGPPPEKSGNGIADALKRTMANGILLLALASIVESLVPWSQLDYRWYWVRICWYWTRYWWIKLSVVLVLVTFLLLLLGIRACVRRYRVRSAAQQSGIA
jgi:hypothetical protein